MKLENKFFNAFFYPFLIGIALSILIVAIILWYYSNDYLDKHTAQDIFNLEKKYAIININSINILLSNALLKIQVGLHEQLVLYNNIASKITDRSKSSIGKDVYNIIDIENQVVEDRINYASMWFVNKTHINIPTDKESDLYQQISIFSQLTQSLYSVYYSMNDILLNIYFLFEETNLFIAFPYTYFKSINALDQYAKFDDNPTWCTDEKGNIIDYYKFRCRDFFNDIMKAKENIFDINIKGQPNRKIYITTPYQQFGNYKEDIIFTMCIQFNDTISKNNAFICGDIKANNLFDSFDSFNEKLIGYFTISSIGFNNAFYYPQMSSSGYGKTLAEYVFRWDKDYYLEEKLDFVNIIQRNLTSNYYSIINKEEIMANPISIFNEIYIDNSKGENQYFYLDREKYNYCIFPIILENYEGRYEHILNIAYIFNKKLFYHHMLDYQEGASSKLSLQLILFIFFGAVLLYLIVLSFKLLAKFIVIPIKNVQYMLEGINIGGEYRLEYLNNLKKKQEDNLEKLNKINQRLMQKNSDKNKKKDIDIISNEVKEIKEKIDMNKINQKLTIRNVDMEKIKENKESKEIEENKNSINERKPMRRLNTNLGAKTVHEEEKLLNTSTEINDNNSNDMNLEYNGELINPKINYDKQYDLDGDIIEKEINFYDFDEELLQYRPIEIDRLVQSLLNLKSALILTSSDHEVENIIDYSNSEYIFNNFKNKEGSRMCQSNIGNLQSQLLKYDKAIYHLALSLQNVELKKFLSLTLSDEIDESDSLLHKIEMNFSKNSKEKEMNELVKRQQNTKHKNFSQKIIGILINSRYNKLIYIYFKFFSFIQKTKYDYEKLSGYFMHTNFHTINYYHKILIQYVYLCFVSNDLVKIGESILDYIEFLIKFKLKTSKENKYILNINNKDIPEIKEKQATKKKYFDKIINWLNLFDIYAKQINENSALGNYKDVIDAYTHNLASNHNEFNSGNQSALLFQVNLQRCDFLKGKFALACKNYSDAVGYMINAAKKKRIVLDGLIKKRALKHIAKIAEKARKTIINKNYTNLNFNETFMGLNNNNKKIQKLNYNMINVLGIIGTEEKNNDEKKDIRIIDKVREIMDYILNDINECNEKQLKDIIILIDCNYSNKLTVDSFIDVTKTILKNYLTNNDRLGVFLLISDHRIICPMLRKCEIDILNFSKDLDTYSDKLFKKERLDSSLGNEIIQEKLEGVESESYRNSQENSFSSGGFGENKEFMNNFEIPIEETIKYLNYCINYLKMKEINTNEKFFIYFNTYIKKLMEYLMDIRDYNNFQNLSYESSEHKKNDLQKDKKIHFLLVGKIGSEENEIDDYKKILLQYFGSKSEMIPFDNMKKIKSILSSNSIINDNIIFPNEVYK